jgi:glycosyltransferase involved in cell wall biosynthesis
VSDIAVSVLMPVRDGERWLAPAVDGILAQTLTAFELIVVDDGSQDATPALLDGYARRDARVRVIRLGREGLVAALNRGIAEARAPLIARLDADDMALPERLARQAQAFAERPALGLLGSWAEIVDASGAPCGRLTPPPDHAALVRLLRRTNPFVHSSVMMRTDLVRDLGGYRRAFEAAEDYDLWLRVSERAEIGNLAECLVRYRRHAANVTHRKAVRLIFSTRLARSAHRARSESGHDPAAALAGPPDWHAAAANAAFYAADARLCRFLEWADPDAAGEPPPLDIAALPALLPGLNHAERKLAQHAVIAVWRRRERLSAAERGALLAFFVRLHPARAIALLPRIWRHRQKKC